MRRTTTLHILSSLRFTIAILLFSGCLAAQQGFIHAWPSKNPPLEYPNDMTPPLPEATVILVASVNEHGKVDSVKIVHPVTPELTDAATQAISSWQFIPAKQDGKPVPSQVNIDVVFTSPHPFVVYNDIWRVGQGGVTPPRAIKTPDPEYTKAARKAKIAGTVVLWLVVNKQGLPEQIRVQKSLDPGLDRRLSMR
jgi:TonB family protein